MDPLGFLQRVVSTPSPSGHEEHVAEVLLEGMQALGLAVDRDAAGNVIGRTGDAEAACHIVLLGHMDTVPGHIPVCQRNGSLYGRGSVDAKGPLVAFVLAAARAAEGGCRAQITVVGAVGEEAYSQGAHHLARTMPAPSCVIIGEPGGWEGVTIGYKGVLSLKWDLSLPAMHSAAGAATPAEIATDFWRQVQSDASLVNNGRSGHFDTLDPSLRAIRSSDDGLQQGAAMHLTLRYPPGMEAEGLLARLSGFCTPEAHLQTVYSEPPFIAPKNTPPVRALLRAIRTNGGSPRFKLKTGTSDMNVVGPIWQCPIVAYGAGDSSLDHTPNEHIDLDEWLRSIEVLRGVLCTLGQDVQATARAAV